MEDINPTVLSDVLFTEYILKGNEIFKLTPQWKETADFDEYITMHKIALVLIELLNIEKEKAAFSLVRSAFEKILFKDNNIYLYPQIKLYMDHLYELKDIISGKLDNLKDQTEKIPWTLACVRDDYLIDNETIVTRTGLGLGWARAWLKEAGIMDNNPVRLVKLSLMWIDAFIAIRNCLNEWNPTKIPDGCDLILTRDEIENCFSMAEKEAESEGGRYVYRVEVVDAWHQFRDNPCAATANKLLLVAPMFYQYFEACATGGNFHNYKSITNQDTH